MNETILTSFYWGVLIGAIWGYVDIYHLKGKMLTSSLIRFLGMDRYELIREFMDWMERR